MPTTTPGDAGPTPQPSTLPAPPTTSVPLVVAVALLTTVALELIRSSGPLLDMAFSRGVLAAAAAALLAYAAAGPIAAGLAAAGGRLLPGSGAVRVSRTLPLGMALLAVLRLVVQGIDGWPRFWIGLLTVALAIAVLTRAVGMLAGRPGGGGAAAGAVAVGGAAGTGLQLGLGTWDAYWRDGGLGWTVTVLLVLGLAVLAAALHRDPPQVGDVPARALWSLGPVLALGAMVLANPAFAASQSGVLLALAGPVAALGLLFTAWATGPDAAALTRRRRPPGARRSGGLLDAVLLPVLVGATFWLDNAFVLLTLVAAQVATIGALAAALEPHVSRRVTDEVEDAEGAEGDVPEPARTPAERTLLVTAGMTSLVGVTTILPLLLYQLDYDVPLGVPNALVVVAVAVALAAAGVRRAVSADDVVVRAAPVPRRRAMLRSAAVLVVLGTAALGLSTWQAYRSSPPLPEVHDIVMPPTTVVSWNLHYGVTPHGDVDLEEIATTIEDTGACVVLLQEVSRGWVMGSGADMGTWLANRLGLRLAFAPAADRQFGNAILSCRPPQDVVVHELPYGDGPQHRSAISATVDRAEPLRFTSVHLQHREENTETRLAQLDTLLREIAAAGAQGRALPLVGGDFNAEPGWPEIELMTGIGFVSAQDEYGDPAVLTSPSIDPEHRIDWVFTPGWSLRDVEVRTDVQTSDHRPLVVTVEP